MTGAAIHGPFGPAATSGGRFVNNNYKKSLSKKHSDTDAPAGLMSGGKLVPAGLMGRA